MLKPLWVLTLFCVASMTTGLQAQAEVATNHAGLQCRDNEAAIRFGLRGEDGPITWSSLPPTRAKHWQNIAVAENGSCKLANGTELRVRGGEKQSYGYGTGGASPPAFFSFWIDGKKVVSREVYMAGYANASPYDNSIFYASGKLERCYFPVSDNSSMQDAPDMTNLASVICKSQNIDLTAFDKDILELSQPDRAEIGRLSIAATYNPGFCRKFVFPAEAYEGKSDATYFRVGPITTEAKEVLALLPLHPEMPFASDQGRYDDTVYSAEGMNLELRTFDFDNDGKVDTVIKISAQTHAFDADVFLVNSDAIDLQAIKSLAQAQDYTIWAKQKGWKIISSDGGYVHYSLFRIRGTTYLLSHPVNLDKRPSAALLRPRSEMAYIDPEPVCIFQTIEENY